MAIIAKNKQGKEIRWGDLIDSNDLSKGKYFPLHADQIKVFNQRTRFTAAIAGTGGGKTVLGPIWCLRQIQEAIHKYGKCLGMIIAPTYKVLSRATMPTFVETLKYTAYEGIYKESKSQYVLPNDWGIIWAQGADNPGGLEGGQFDFVWGDEGGQFKKKTFDAITGRTGAKMSPILITTTPYGLGALFQEWYKPFKAGDTDYFVHSWSSFRNPAYPDEEYERAKKSMTPEKFAERYDGQFMNLEGLVYPSLYRNIIPMENSEMVELLRSPGHLYGGIDFGWNDPFCALNGFLSSNATFGRDVLYIWFERYKSQTAIETHAEALPKKINGKTPKWFADHNPELIKKLRKGGHTVVKAKKDIVTGISAVNHRCYTNRIKIIENRCIATIAEAETYVYPDKDEEIIGDRPVDRDNHAMDALRYLVMGIDFKKAA